MGEVLGAERTALPGWLAKVHYSPWSAAGGNKCSRKPQPRVVQLNTGNNGHRSTGRGKSRSRWMLVFWGGSLVWRGTGNDRMQETLAQHLGQTQTKFRGGKKESSNMQPDGSR